MPFLMHNAFLMHNWRETEYRAELVPEAMLSEADNEQSCTMHNA